MVFFNCMDSVYRGWCDVGGGVDGKPEADYTFHSDTDSSTASPVVHINSLNVQERSRRS